MPRIWKNLTPSTTQHRNFSRLPSRVVGQRTICVRLKGHRLCIKRKASSSSRGPNGNYATASRNFLAGTLAKVFKQHFAITFASHLCCPVAVCDDICIEAVGQAYRPACHIDPIVNDGESETMRAAGIARPPTPRIVGPCRDESVHCFLPCAPCFTLSGDYLVLTLSRGRTLIMLNVSWISCR